MNSESKHIVIAEDDPQLSALFERFLSTAGFRTTTAPNGGEAFSVIENCLLTNTVVDLLLTDISMPVMNGEELIAALRRQSIQIPIIAMSGNRDKEQITNLMRHGCQDFIGKPFGPHELHERVFITLARTKDDMKAVSLS